LSTIRDYAPQIISLLNDRAITDAQAVLYAADGAFQIRWDDENAGGLGTRK
jgi:hypothetical protein